MDQIICPSCKKPVPITEAISHQLQEKLQKEKEEYRSKMLIAFQKRMEEEKTKLEKAQQEQSKLLEEKLKQKVQKDMELQLLDTRNAKDELEKQNKMFQEQLLEMSKLNRQLKMQDEQRKIEMEKKIAEEQEKIRLDEKKHAEEENRLRMMEMEKKLNDALKVNDELKRKLEQGSQQAQGEVLELQVEELLHQEFPTDEIKEVPKGQLGADLIQKVFSRSGNFCGTIVWELKRTKAWKNEWIQKLKDDQRELKAEVAVIISDILPPEISFFGCKENIWVGNYKSIIGLALLLRKSILDVSAVKAASIGKKEKMEMIWEYLTSTEFTQRMEAIVEAFSSIQGDIEMEKRWFKKKWEKQERSIRMVIDNTMGLRGNLQSIMGKALPEVSGLDIMVEADVEETPILLNNDLHSNGKSEQNELL